MIVLRINPTNTEGEHLILFLHAQLWSLLISKKVV